MVGRIGTLFAFAAALPARVALAQAVTNAEPAQPDFAAPTAMVAPAAPVAAPVATQIPAVSAAAAPVPPAPPSTPTEGQDSFAPAGDKENLHHRPTSEWYGLPLVVVDGLSFALIGAGRAANSESVEAAGAAAVIVDGLLVHAFAYPPRNAGTGLAKGFLSLLLRGGLGVGVCAIGSDCFDQHLSDGALARLTAGLAVAAIVDDAFLARRRLSTGPATHAFEVFPSLALSGGSARVGAVGRF